MHASNSNHEHIIKPLPPKQSSFFQSLPENQRIDFAEVKGQHVVRCAVEIAVSGPYVLTR
ncbi:MAG: hypothetical protein VX051_01475 [Verrucomicrobiota bacterium]|nr:hypothetical protein [Verrucomicrobiota bacterium]